MIVMKFGGTSVEDAGSIERVAEIIRDRLALRPVVIVSAMGKTTRKLLRAATASAAGDNRTCISIVVDLKARHKGESRRLSANDFDTLARLDGYFSELGKLLEGLAILGEVPPRGLDKILAYGELLSSTIVAAALKSAGIPVCLLDARELIRTNDHYGAAVPIFEETNSQIRERLAPRVQNGEVPVLQGFIGSTRGGATTTLGFEGSDYTAAIVGAALGAGDIQIWKDVSGLMTADPALIPGARTVKLCSYAEAAQLTYFGAKVLHPKAIYPAAERGIPVHIYNSKQPQATGTEITAQAPPCANLVKSIAYKQTVTVLHVAAGTGEHGAGEGRPGEILPSLPAACTRAGANVLVAAASAASAIVILDARSLGEERERDLLDEISRFGSAHVDRDKALITLVGQDLARDPGMAARVLNAVGETEVGIVLYGLSPLAINLVVDAGRAASALSRLHEAFFQDLDPVVFASGV